MSPPIDPNPQDTDLDALLAAHFTAALSPYAGKAAGGFREHLARQRRMRVIRLSSAAAIAAGVVIAWGLASSWFAGPSTTPAVPAPFIAQNVQPPDSPITQSAYWSRVMDDGLGLVDKRPVRQFRRNIVEEVNWYDPRTQARVKQTTPRQEIFLIGVQTD